MKRTTTLAAILVLALLAAPRGAEAVPEFAKQWDSNCGSCHVGAPTELDEEGIAFKLAGYNQEVEAKTPRPKLFFSFLADLATYTDNGAGSDVERPESATLFSLLRLDREGVAKVFAIGELVEQPEGGVDLDFAHGHLQLNPLAERERLNVRLGNIEPITRLWNTDMRRVFESPLWGGVDSATGALAAGGGGHAHAHGSSAGRPGVLPASDWGGDISSVLRRDLLVAGGYAGDSAFAGVFWKRGGRGFDNSTVESGFDYNELTEEERDTFNREQTKLARKWERSVIVGLSGYSGSGSHDVFDGSFLSAAEAAHDEHGEEEAHGDEHAEGEEAHGDEHGEEGDDHGEEGDDHGEEGDDHGEEGDDHGEEGDDHGEEGDDHGEEHGAEEVHSEAIFPTRMTGTSRVVGEFKTRYDRYGVYVVGVYGSNDYDYADPDQFEEQGLFQRSGSESKNFFAWAIEGSARFNISRKLTGRVALRYEELAPEDDTARDFERAIANLTVPVRMMRPALWPYLEIARNLTLDDSEVRVGIRFGY